jgi:membrane associated rhomboid family serine protease
LIPLRDLNPNHTTPLVNWALIGACSLAFVAEIMAGSSVDQMIHRYGLIPARFTGLRGSVGGLDPDAFLPLLSSMFLHGGLGHFGGNMLFLWIFGDNVEDRLGHLGYLAFYLVGGLAAGFAHVASDPASVVPTIGASGAIAAVMGAYFVLHPAARIESLMVVGFFITTVAVPSVVYLAVWFGMQLLLGTAQQLSGGDGGGVAWWAHAGGFAFGGLVILVLGRRPRRRAC